MWFRNNQEPERESGSIELRNGQHPDKRADIVFVHGLGGDARETWRHQASDGDNFWPRWFGEDLAGESESQPSGILYPRGRGSYFDRQRLDPR